MPSSVDRAKVEGEKMAPAKRKKKKSKTKGQRKRERRERERQALDRKDGRITTTIGAADTALFRRNVSVNQNRPVVWPQGRNTFENGPMVCPLPQWRNNFETITDGKEITEIDFATLSQEIWAKKRCLKLPHEYLPKPRHFFYWPTWIGVELRDRKHELNKIKSRLDNYPLDKWHRHTKQMNTAGRVMPLLKSDIRPEYCSQAWCKMYECWSNFPLIPKSVTDYARQPGANPRFFSVHLCEAPGAFISATNHYMSTNYPQIKWDWLATTLNPHHEGNDVGAMINEDALILTSVENWGFLKDSTGNIMNQANLNSLINEVQNKCKAFNQTVNLVTADGSVDCQKNPMEQEKIVAELQFAEIIAALSILGVGGNFVLKIFTFLECQTINHLYILCSMFREVHLFKPSTSKEGNSEVYVICLHYLGSHTFSEQLDQLKRQVGVESPLARRHSLISKKLVFVEPFIDRILRANLFFTGYQMAIIKRNILTFEARNDLNLIYYQHDIIRTEVSWEWLKRCDVKILPHENSLFKLKCRSRQITHVDPRTELGTHNDKLRLNQSADFLVKTKEIERQIKYYHTFGHDSWNISEISGSCSKLIPLMGRPYADILSSRFCFGKILSLRHDLIKAARPYMSSKEKIEVKLDSRCESCNAADIHCYFSQVLPDLMDSRETWEFYCYCCKMSVIETLNCYDIQIMHKHLRQALLKVSELKVGQSLYLCQLPLLSRLQLGFVYSLKSVFAKVVLGAGGMYNSPRGILLHRYLGVTSIEQKTLLIELANIVNEIGNTKKLMARNGDAVLEIVPIKNLIELDNFNDILKYNLMSTASHLSQIIKETKEAIMKQQQQLPNSEGALLPQATNTLEFQSNPNKPNTTPTPRGI